MRAIKESVIAVSVTEFFVFTGQSRTCGEANCSDSSAAIRSSTLAASKQQASQQLAASKQHASSNIAALQCGRNNHTGTQ